MSGKSFDFDVEIPRISSVATDLANLTVEMLVQAKHDEYDHFAFMASTFVCRQLSHMKSVLGLVDAGQYKDASIITRVMVEGCAILLWANAEPNERPLNWRAYVWIDQFKRLYGKSSYPEHQAEIEAALDKYCRQYLRKGSEGKIQSDIVPDDYVSKWRMDDVTKGKFVEKRIKDIFKETGLGSIHTNVYSLASSWVHWDSFSMAETIKREANGNIVCGVDPQYVGAMAIMSGFQALVGSALLLDKYLKMGFYARLMTLVKTIRVGT